MRGSIEPLEDGKRGTGVAVWGYSFPGEVSVGTSPGSRRRVTAWIGLPRAEGPVEAAYMSIGVLLDRDDRPPVSWKLSVDGVSIAREFKPQFCVEVDDGLYCKAVYDVRPLLSRRLAEREEHRVFIARDAYRPVRISDIFLYARYRVEGARYASSYHVGAVALEPGEALNVYVDIGRSFDGRRTAGVLIRSPNHMSLFRIVAGGSKPVEAGGRGGLFVEVSVPYKGSPVPVSVKYEEPETRFYPKTAVVSDIVVVETVAPEPRPRIIVERVSREGSRIVVEGRVVNEGDAALSSPMLVAVAVGVQAYRGRLSDVEPGGEAGFRVQVDVSRLPLEPRVVQLRLVWSSLGRRSVEVAEVPVPPTSS